MFYIIENGRITNSSDNFLETENGTTIEKDFSQEELEKIKSGYFYNIQNGEFIESEESRNFDKQNDISIFKEMEKKATEKRAEYLTAEMLPDGIFKEMKLEKLIKEGDEIKEEYENKMKELISKYGEEILQELL